jgi:hypothetical protein
MNGKESAGQAREVIVMQPGPVHLFWTTGVHFFWRLKSHFNFVFIVPTTYKNSPDFLKIVSLQEVSEVLYIDVDSSLRSHREFFLNVSSILNRARPKFALLHNQCYVENQYLLALLEMAYPGVRRFHYQNGRASLNWKADFAARVATDLERLKTRIPSIFRLDFLLQTLLTCFYKYSFFLNFKIFPLLTTGRAFQPYLNIYSGKISSTPVKGSHALAKTSLLAYLDVEIDSYRRQGFQRILKIEHPLKLTQSEVFRFLGLDHAAQDLILIVPTYGYTSRLIDLGWSEDRVCTHVANRWGEGIGWLKREFPGFRVELKLHPIAAREPIWISICESLRLHHPDLVLLDSKINVEAKAACARVIAGDVTSVLWWSSFLPNKAVFSFDIFDFPGGDEMKTYGSRITYISSLAVQNRMPRNERHDSANTIPIESIFEIGVPER